MRGGYGRSHRYSFYPAPWTWVTLQVRSLSLLVWVQAGAFAGFLWLLLHRMWRGSPHEYPLTLGALMVLYVIIDRTGGSAALGNLTTLAVIIGNANLFSRWFKMDGEANLTPNHKIFHGVITFMVKSFFFTFIGLMLYSPGSLFLLGVILALGLLLARIPGGMAFNDK